MADYSPVNPNDEEYQLAAAKAKDYNVITMVSGLVRPYDVLFYNYQQDGVFIQPLINGQFPKSVLDAFEKTNKEENLNIPRLIQFTNDEQNDLKGINDCIHIQTGFEIKPFVRKKFGLNIRYLL